MKLPITSLAELIEAGKILAQTDSLGVRNAAEGFLVASMCHQEDISYLEFASTYNLIAGRIAIKAEAMLAKLLELGGEYEVIAHTPEAAAIKLRYGKAEYVSRLTWSEAQTESFTKGRNGQLKDNWSTPRRRAQMMWARVVSDGCRVVCPLVTRGKYTPEEVQDFDDVPAAPAADNAVPASVKMPAGGKIGAVAAAPAAEEVDHSICRVPGPLMGKKWAEVELDILKMALTIKHPGITDDDREVIKTTIQQKEGQNESTNDTPAG